MNSKINFNGKEYNSFNEIPDEFKVMFKDENNNGIPDFVEGLLNSGNKNNIKPITANFSTFFYKGKQYSSIDELPSEARQIVQSKLKNLESKGVGINFPNSESKINIINQNTEQANTIPNDLKKEAQHELNPNFKFRLILTAILFILTVLYLFWFFRMF
ncbi:MAG: hypothetical protein IT280_07905 [Ignavibacteria bacterium]|nr:hypothetical protein [Ignavibacteria bacterium]